MKTPKLPVLLMALFCSVTLRAQQPDRLVRFMIQAEPHVNWMHADENHLSDGPERIGIGAGFRMDFQFEKYGAFSFGLGVNQTGGSLNFADTLYLDRTLNLDTLGPGACLTYRLQYVEIPLAIKFNLPEIGYTTWFTEFGLDPMFNTKALIDASEETIYKESFQQGVGWFNLGYHAGLGAVYSFGNNLSLQVLIVYRNTFLDVTRENDIRKPDNSRINQVGLSIGLMF